MPLPYSDAVGGGNHRVLRRVIGFRDSDIKTFVVTLRGLGGLDPAREEGPLQLLGRI